MSKIEDYICSKLGEEGIIYERQKLIPITSLPWTYPNKMAKSDIYIPCIDTYIEVKGFMTLESMFKIYYFLSKKEINYMLFQATEPDFIDFVDKEGLPISSKININIDVQLQAILKVIKGELIPSSLRRGSILSMQSFVSMWLGRFKGHNLNLFDIDCMVESIDPDLEVYCENEWFQSDWCTGYPGTE
jgi:hypothetical protein